MMGWLMSSRYLYSFVSDGWDVSCRWIVFCVVSCPLKLKVCVLATVGLSTVRSYEDTWPAFHNVGPHSVAVTRQNQDSKHTILLSPFEVFQMFSFLSWTSSRSCTNKQHFDRGGNQ